jgi:hypothetical protein
MKVRTGNFRMNRATCYEPLPANVTVVSEKLEAYKDIPISHHLPLNAITRAEMNMGNQTEKEMVLVVLTKYPVFKDCSGAHQPMFFLTIYRDDGRGQVVLELDRDELVGRKTIEFSKGNLYGSVPFDLSLTIVKDVVRA